MKTVLKRYDNQKDVQAVTKYYSHKADELEQAKIEELAARLNQYIAQAHGTEVANFYRDYTTLDVQFREDVGYIHMYSCGDESHLCCIGKTIEEAFATLRTEWEAGFNQSLFSTLDTELSGDALNQAKAKFGKK